MTLTIYHNPRCSKSRKTLELLEEHGQSPRVVPYLDEPPDAATLLALTAALSLPLKAILRTAEDDFKAADDRPDLDNDEQLAVWLQRHPRVLERPIVVDEDSGRAVIGRPPENVLKLLRK